MATQQLFDFAGQPSGSPRSRSEPSPREPDSFSSPGPVSSLPTAVKASISVRSASVQADDSVCSDNPPAGTEPATGSRQTLERLRESIRQVTSPKVSVFSSGSETVDTWLPDGGLPGDGITEWIDASPGNSGAAMLAFVAAQQATQGSADDRGLDGSALRKVLVVDPDGSFYPPAAMGLGLRGEQIIWCRPQSMADTVWTIDQALRCRSVGAVVAWVDRRLDHRDARRFQLAAEKGQTPGLFIRPASVRGLPSFTKLRLHVSGLPVVPPSDLHLPGVPPARLRSFVHARFFRVTLDRLQGGTPGRQAVLLVDDQFRIQEVSESLVRRMVRTTSLAVRTTSLASSEMPRSQPAHSQPTRASKSHATAALHLASRLADPTTKASRRHRAG